MTAAMASVLMQTQLFFTTLLGVALLGESLTKTGIYALLLAAIGLVCFAISAVQGGGDITLAGLLLNLAAAGMWAVSNIVARRAQRLHPDFDALQYVVWISLVPIVPFIVLAWALDPAEVRWNWLGARDSSWASVVFLGLIATVTAYAMWTQLLKRHPASRVAPFSLGVPVVGLVAAIVLLGETVTALQWLGSGLVVGALVVFMGWRRGP
jgi:O-acetylserine/cysteine efflux transporter